MNEEPARPDLPQEEDQIPWRRVLFGFGVMLAVMAVMIAVAFGILQAREERLRPGRLFPEQTLNARDLKSEVHEDLFSESPGFGQQLNEQKRRALSTYGWVDKERRIIRVPIDQAMDIVVEENRR
jgi:hypothetical protein